MSEVINVHNLIREIEDIERRLEDIKIELLKLKAQQLEAEEINDEEADQLIREAEKAYKSGEWLTIEEFRKEVGLDWHFSSENLALQEDVRLVTLWWECGKSI